MKRSVIRELLKLTAKPGIISFAGGLPAPATFPVDYVEAAVDGVIEEEHETALQYGPTEGDARLREDFAIIMRKDGIKTTADHILITTASQQGLDLVAKIFLNPGDTCITGSPTYLGGLQAFKSYQGVPVGVELDDRGMIPEKLEETIVRLEGENRKPRFIYIIPDFQNPAGVTIPESRRRQILDIARKGEYLIIEDTPYRQLRYSGQSQPTFQSMAPEMVLSLYTISKILLPGFRLGWACGPDWIVDKMVMAKQAVDLCTPPFTQAITHAMLVNGALEKGLETTIQLYSNRRKLMLSCLEKEFAEIEGVSWTKPEGGLFLWLTLPEGMSTEEIFEQAIEEKVAYVPGSAFYPNNDNFRSMRLNFSYASEEQICEGVKRLGKVVRKNI
ncbi:MAG: PLP-dependent aminotransferase family protein [Candidatus Fermentibacteraceae bacterium]|nr:PLP-dependent aminotransferase family protein [Candidatus Fermentibacteraceae bacterium]